MTVARSGVVPVAPIGLARPSVTPAGTLPNVVIAGAPKCGTTALFEWLADHPDVFPSSKKETQYFMDRDSSVFRPAANIHDHGIEGYRGFFKGYTGAESVVLEATPGYLYQETALERLPEALPDAHFLFLLREPAARFYSTFSYFQQNRAELDTGVDLARFVQLVDAGDEQLRWNEFLRDARAHGRYVEYLDQWRARFGSERIHAFVYEDLRRDPLAFVQRLSGLLGIDPSFYDDYVFGAHNSTYRVKSHAVHRLVTVVRSWIPQSGLRDRIRGMYHRVNTSRGKGPLQPDAAEALAAIKAYYQPFNEALASRYGLDLASWS